MKTKINAFFRSAFNRRRPLCKSIAAVKVFSLLALMPALALGESDFSYSGTNFEQSNWSNGDAVVGFQDDKTEGDNQFWSTNDVDSLAVIKEEDTGKGNLIKEWKGEGDTKVLSIKSKLDRFVYRGVVTNETDGSLTATGVHMDECVYFDGLVNFTALDEDFVAGNMDGLLSVWMREDEDSSATNLFVTAGYATGDGLVMTNYDCGPVSDYLVAPGDWGRLTIKMFSDITDGAEKPGFAVFVNGNPVSFAGAKGDGGAFWTASLSDRAKAWGDKLFPAVSASGGEDKLLLAAPPVPASGVLSIQPCGFVVSVIGTSDGYVRGMGFSGQGMVDELTFASSDVSRGFAADPCWLKIPAAKDGYSYVVSNNTSGAVLTGELVNGTNNYIVANGDSVKVYFTLTEGYVWKDVACDNPKTIENIVRDIVVDATELPTALALMGVAAFDATKTYDGKATNVTWTVTNYLGVAITDAAISLREQGDSTWSPVADFTPYVDTTNVTVEVKAEKSGFTTASNEATVVISPRAVTLTSGTESFGYDGQAHSNMTVTVSGADFVAGQGVTTNGFATITDTSVSVPNAFTYAFAEGTKAENYSVSCVTGTLTVTKATIDPEKNPDRTWPAAGDDPEKPADVADPEIPFSCFDTTNVYDGAAHTIDTNALVNAYKESFLGNAPSFTYALSSNGSYSVSAPAFTDVTVTSVWYKVSAENFEDVIHPAKVIVTNRCVTLTSADAWWPYDAQAHSTNGVEVSGAGFVAGEGVTTNSFATITDVGSKPNAFSYEFLDGTKAENYSVSCVTGTLTIAGYFVEYNGSGADGALAEGTMETNTFGTGIVTNLTRCAFTLKNFVFSGWTTNGVDKAYDDEAEGADFAQSGETLSLTALWTRVIVPVTVTNLANTTVSVTTNGVAVERFAELTDSAGFIYNVQTNANVTIVYRAVSGWAFDASGTNGTVVLSNVTYDVERQGCFVPEDALPKVVEITEIITEGDFKTELDGTIIITNCHPTADGVLIIPAKIGDKEVKAIADKAFQYATWLKELVIENGPTEIGNAAFDNCTGLERVVIPASVTKVGQVAFMRCFALKSLEFAGNAPTMQKLPKLGYGVCWGAHGFTVKVDPAMSGWNETSLGALCAGWQLFVPAGDGMWTCNYDAAAVVPRITGVKWLDAGSTLTVNNVKPGLTYTLETSACLGAKWESVGNSKTGGATDTLEFEIPGDPGTSAFFRVKVSDGSYK